MTPEDKKQFAVLMGGLSAAFGRDANKETMAIYFQYLSDYSIEAVRHGVDMAIKTGERFPVVARLREYAGAYRPPVNRRPVIEPEYQIEEFTEYSGGSKYSSPEEFFEAMTKDLGEKMSI